MTEPGLGRHWATQLLSSARQIPSKPGIKYESDLYRPRRRRWINKTLSSPDGRRATDDGQQPHLLLPPPLHGLGRSLRGSCRWSRGVEQSRGQDWLQLRLPPHPSQGVPRGRDPRLSAGRPLHLPRGESARRGRGRGGGGHQQWEGGHQAQCRPPDVEHGGGCGECGELPGAGSQDTQVPGRWVDLSSRVLSGVMCCNNPGSDQTLHTSPVEVSVQSHFLS